MRYTYLYINLATVAIPFLATFHRKIRFNQTWPFPFTAILLTAFVFLVWDSFFTHLGVWEFNPDYLTGLYIGNLPIEEVLFFFCIPYACLFTFYCFGKIPVSKWFHKAEKIITVLLLLNLFVVGVLFYDRLYTMITCFALAFLLAFARFVLNVDWFAQFYLSYTILLLPFFVVNGMLTGSWLPGPVVLYNSQEILGLRILTIPVEDIFYGMLLVLLNVVIYSQLTIKYRYGKEEHIVSN